MPAQSTRAAGLFVALFAVGACTAEDTTPTWHGDIRPIVEARCVNCHGPGAIGPFQLDTYAGAKKVASAMWHAVHSREMPPWHASDEVKYAGDPSLTKAQIQAVSDWVAGGTPEGDPDAPGATIAKVGLALSRVDRELSMTASYTPKADVDDDYRCFLIDWPEPKDTFVTGFNARPGNLANVHHVAVYLLSPNAPLADDAFKGLAELDAKEDGPGYTCYGGPSGASGLKVPIQQIGQWVPGMQGMDFPAGTGIPAPAKSRIVLQVHYSMEFAPPGPDKTSLEFKLDSKVERKAAFAPWLDLVWPLGNMPIAAGDQVASHIKTDDPREFWKIFTGDMDTSQGFVIHSALLHMHTLGSTAHTAIERADGSEQMILRVPHYDFDWQRIYVLDKPLTFVPGDKLTVRCQWDNGPANQVKINGKVRTPADVNWGEGTLDEMCVANLYISEL